MAEPLPSFPVAQQKGDPISWPEKVTLQAVPPTSTRRRGLEYQLKRSLQRSWETAQNTTTSIGRKLSAKASYMRRERPLQVIAVFAIAGILAGVGLRIWRSQHE